MREQVSVLMGCWVAGMVIGLCSGFIGRLVGLVRGR